MHSPIPPASPRRLLPPLLASLPGAPVSLRPPKAILPLLSPILRQRVNFLSGSTEDPWLPLLCYDRAKVSHLSQIVQGENFEPHPVSGEVEIDWATKVETRYNRVDEETVQALVNIRELGLAVKLVWCIGDQEGGGDGWRICEVTVLDSDARSQEGWENIEDAERQFKEAMVQGTQSKKVMSGHSQSDEDDGYWAQYDSSPGRTPTNESPPAPDSLRNGEKDHNDEDAYYNRYSSVQPAADKHDPEEAARSRGIETTLGVEEMSHPARYHPGYRSASSSGLAQPRPTSSGSSNGKDTVAKLEKTAADQRQGEIAIKQHISTTIKGLFRLARASGIARVEFERLVRTELDVLSLIEDDD